MGVIEFILFIIFFITLYYCIKYYNNHSINKKEKCNTIYIPQSIEEEGELQIETETSTFSDINVEEQLDNILPNELIIADKTMSVPAFITNRITQSFNI